MEWLKQLKSAANDPCDVQTIIGGCAEELSKVAAAAWGIGTCPRHRSLGRVTIGETEFDDLMWAMVDLQKKVESLTVHKRRK